MLDIRISLLALGIRKRASFLHWTIASITRAEILKHFFGVNNIFIEPMVHHTE